MKVSDRYDANMTILNLLKYNFLENPSLRFEQALLTMGVIQEGVDGFYTESQVTLNRVLEEIKRKRK